MFSGKLMAIIGAKLEPGSIRVKVSSAGMPAEELELEADPVDPERLSGVSACTENLDLPCVMGGRDEIPLRRIEIESGTGRQFHADLRQITVRAKLFPADASYREVEWSVVDDAGIATNIAKIRPEGHSALVTALGDGAFRVRCTSRNGTAKTKLISQLEFRVAGIGMAFQDPYSFVSAGLYDYSNGEVSNGNERGVATSRENETQVGFHHLDFGPYGSDSITIPIFALSSEEYPLQEALR